MEELYYLIALSQVDKVGDVTARTLISYCGSAEQVFKTKASQLIKIPGIGALTAQHISKAVPDELAQAQWQYCMKHEVKITSYLSDDYPHRLKHYPDSPILLYQRGSANLNPERTIGIVGTRNMSLYGESLTEALVRDLAGMQISILSGLAYGVDTHAHRSCVEHNITTIGVMATGIDRVYPSENRRLADQMCENGALITEYPIKTDPDRENFPRRNRIVAAMSDALVVIESARDGGSMITAAYAFDYNKDVFVFPGRITDFGSSGNHLLIKQNKAQLIESAEDLKWAMAWYDETASPAKPKRELFYELDEMERCIVGLLQDKGELHIDQLSHISGYTQGQLANLLLQLEFKAIVKTMPGKRYALSL